MSLSTRLILSVLIFLTCTGLLGVSALTGMRGMRTHFDAAAERYEQLRTLYEIGNRAAITRQLLAAEEPNRELIGAQLAVAIQAVGRAEDPGQVEGLGDRLRDAALALDTEGGLRAASANANAALDQVTRLVGDAKASIIDNRRMASEKLTTTIRLIVLLGIATIFAGAVVGLLLYRSIMRPVRSLASATDRLANAEFGRPVTPQGDREFRALIEHFNRMSVEIDRLHTTMQGAIERTSRRLVRSEQLASVGSLAAGLAHEINNPLGIIAGYAESTARKLQGADDRAVDPELRQKIDTALATIEEEAYRCSAITRELLDMARPASEAPAPVDLGAVVRRGVSLVGGAAVAQGRELRIEPFDEEMPIAVLGDASQLLQVLINLITNALEATQDEGGRVVVSVEASGDVAVVTVADNGCGMGEATLRQVFDPFYTEKASRGQRGVGLGLSISHAIATRHGGRLDASSSGPGRGSTLTLELPICGDAVRGAVEEVAYAGA